MLIPHAHPLLYDKLFIIWLIYLSKSPRRATLSQDVTHVGRKLYTQTLITWSLANDLKFIVGLYSKINMAL